MLLFSRVRSCEPDNANRFKDGITQVEDKKADQERDGVIPVKNQVQDHDRDVEKQFDDDGEQESIDKFDVLFGQGAVQVIEGDE